MSTMIHKIGLASVLWSVLRREVSLALRQKGEVLTPLVFFIVIASLFPLGIGPESALLLRMAPGVLWVSALLAAMLSLQRLFAMDFADGTLEQMVLSSTPLGLLVFAKATAHFLLSGLPLVMAAPILGLQFGLDERALGVLVASEAAAAVSAAVSAAVFTGLLSGILSDHKLT